MESLGDILKGKESPAVEQPKPEARADEVVAETPATETAEQKAERERDEKGRFKAKESDAQTPAKPDAQKAPEQPKVEKPAPTAEQKATPATKPDESQQPPSGFVPVKALQEERRQRQELQRQLQAQQQQPKVPDVATDPQGFQQHLMNTLQAREIDTRVNLSAAWARRQYQDFDSVMESWNELLAENPLLYQQAVQQDLPAEWAYKHVKRHQLMQKIGDDPDGYINTEVEKRFNERQAEVAAKQPPPRPAAPVPPPSLASAPSGSAAITTAQTFDGPTPLKTLFRR